MRQGYASSVREGRPAENVKLQQTPTEIRQPMELTSGGRTFEPEGTACANVRRQEQEDGQGGGNGISSEESGSR